MPRAAALAGLAGYLMMAAGCATSMTPSQFNERLPAATRARFYDMGAATNAIAAGECSLLVAGRKYTCPIGLTVSVDLKGGARGVDEWVTADGGNAYAVGNFEWVTVGDSGATQLTIYFDTLRCT